MEVTREEAKDLRGGLEALLSESGIPIEIGS
jgi:hypothetical protein